MKVYVTKYASTSGIFIAEGDFYDSVDSGTKYFSSVKPHLFLGPPDYALTAFFALLQARKKIAAKIKTSEKSLEKLRAIDPEAQIEALSEAMK